jgi:two-component system, NarL family, nitrate/nitrite response regulator NarL
MMGSFPKPALQKRPWTKTDGRFSVQRKPENAANGNCAAAKRKIRFMPKIPVLVIEDNRLLRGRIASMLMNQGDFDVIQCGEAGDTIRQMKVRRPQPRVVLLNPGFEDGQGLKLAALLREELPEAKAITMDILPDRTDVIQFVKAGVRGFILKNAREADYVKTIKTVAEGFNVLPPVLTGSLFTQIVESALESGVGTEGHPMPLTGREREIVDLISKGLGNKEIAAHLHIATFTVKSHIHSILEKLGFSSRLQIAVFATGGIPGNPEKKPDLRPAAVESESDQRPNTYIPAKGRGDSRQTAP